MNTPPDKSIPATAGEPAASAAPEASAGSPGAKRPTTLPFDPLRLVSALWLRRRILLISGLVLSTLAGAAGWFKLATVYKSGAQLMRQESSATFRASELGEPFKPRQLSVQTLVSFMKSPAVLQRVAERAQLPARTIAAGLTIVPERNTDIITLGFTTARSAQTAIRVINTFGGEVVRLTREMQSQEAAEMNRLLKRQLGRAEEDLRAVGRELLDFSRQAGLINADKEIDAYLRSLGDLDMRQETTRIDYETLDLKIAAMERELSANNPLAERAQVAREKLAELLRQYTEANPLVEEQREVLAEIEARLKDSGNRPMAVPRQGESSLATSFYADLVNLKTQKSVAAAQIEKLKSVRAGLEEKLRSLPEKGMQLARIRARQQSLETAQALLSSRQREAQLYEDNAIGYYRFFEAKPDEVDVVGRGKKIVILAVAGGIAGFLFAAAIVCLVESFDDRVKTVADLRRVTGLPLLAAVPDFARLDAVAQSNWAFRTWLALQAKLAAGPRRQLVCGFLSESGGEGCSTLIEALGLAAGQRNESVLVVTNRAPLGGVSVPIGEALARPSAVAPASGEPRWLLVPPGWRWDNSRRAQWKQAVEAWSECGGLRLLVELTPADQPETLLFAEDMGQLVWLAGAGQARGGATSQRLQTFRHAGCRFAGAVLNRPQKLFPWP